MSAMSPEPRTDRAQRRLGRLWTVRTRLTLLYGGLFLLSGIALLGISYALVNQATQGTSVTVVLPDGRTVSANVEPDADTSAGDDGPPTSNSGGPAAPGEQDALPDPAKLQQIAAEQHAQTMTTLLTRSSIALGIMAIVSVVLGWIIAGRVLRLLRKITATTRRITSENLHERLALAGPADELTGLGDTIDDLLSRLDRSFQAHRLFVANASHELRTPLARQRTIAQVALDDPDATAETLRTAHERVLAAGARQEHLIDALLTLARGQAGIDRSEPVDLARIASDALASRRSDAEAAGVSIAADIAPAVTHGDPRLIERCVTNLLDNAIRYNHREGTVHLTTTVRGPSAALVIANTGPTIQDDQFAALTEPFRRLDTHRSHVGDAHGLGLSIVKAIADAHHADLTIEPRASGGLHIEIIFAGTDPRPPR